MVASAFAGGCGDADATPADTHRDTHASGADDAFDPPDAIPDSAPDADETANVPDSARESDSAAPVADDRFPSNVPAGFTLHDLGSLATVDGETADITFDVPADARRI